jgi:hypothetical protein
MDAAAATRFEAEIARYNRWRGELTQSVHAYHDWLENNKQLDVQQSIRFYDLLENLNKGRLMLAFLAEFSRGKSELINALFFSNFKERLLPSDVGRTTMCPTEIFHDPSEEPYLKLLSVETRYRDESISQLKNMPVEWSKVRLNVNSAADMKKALKALADVKKVYALEARMLGLAPMLNEDGEAPGEEELVEVPRVALRHDELPAPAALQRPVDPRHAGTQRPGHGARAHGEHHPGGARDPVPALDRHRRHQERPRDLGPLRAPGLPQKIAVLNKVDLMWDELKSAEEIQKAIDRMIETTASHLHLPKERIFALSAQKGLLGRIRDDAALVKKSGIDRLETFLAEEIVPMKRQILCKAVVSEIGGMMNSSRASVAKRQQANQAEIAELNGLVGKSREVVTRLWAKITEEKNAYNAALTEYKVNSATFNHKRSALMELLNVQRLDQMLAANAKAIEDSWTTVTLQRSMNALVKDMSEDFEKAFTASEEIKKLMVGVYATFIEKFGFQKMKIPSLDLDPQRTKLQLLVHQTEAFVKDPLNVFGKEKHFVVKNFYATLVKAARGSYMDAKNQSERWAQAVVLPLEVQIKDHKAQLQSRLDNLAKINEKTGSINEQMKLVKAVEADLRKQRDMIEGLIQRVSEHEATSSLGDSGIIPPRDPGEPPEELLRTTKFNVNEMSAAAAEVREMTARREAEKAAAAPKPAPRPAPAQASPLVSDDLMSQIGGLKSGTAAPAPQVVAAAASPERTMPGFDPMTTQKMAVSDTQKLPTADPTTTQRLPTDTQKLPATDRTKTIKLPDK